MPGKRVAISLWVGAITGALYASGVPHAIAAGDRHTATTTVATAFTLPLSPDRTLSTSPGEEEPSPAVRQAIAASNVIAFAQSQLGKPYVWGGTGPRGFDCSGLIQRAFAVVGVHLPRGTIAQSKAGIRISRSDLLPGDLVFSNGLHHVQLYIGDNKVIEAAHSGTLVRVSKMLPAWMINAYVRIPMG